MALYTVHVPREAADTMVRAERTQFVRDGFSLTAFLFGPLYLMRHGAWMAAAAWIVVVVAGGWLCHLFGLSLSACLGLALLVMLFTGLEASSIRRFTLYRGGLDIAGVVACRTLEEGEQLFFRNEQVQASLSTQGAAARPVRLPPTGVFGLFPGEGM